MPGRQNNRCSLLVPEQEVGNRELAGGLTCPKQVLPVLTAPRVASDRHTSVSVDLVSESLICTFTHIGARTHTHTHSLCPQVVLHFSKGLSPEVLPTLSLLSGSHPDISTTSYLAALGSPLHASRTFSFSSAPFPPHPSPSWLGKVS